MSTEPSKYAENQVEVATRGRMSLLEELAADMAPRLLFAQTNNSFFDDALTLFNGAKGEWDTGWLQLANAEAAQLGKTMLVEDLLASLTRKPSTEENSIIETWDTTIRSQVAYQGSVYRTLLPQGRETLTVGSIDERILGGQGFAARLAQQTTKPALVTLGTTVGQFYTQAELLRTGQRTAMTLVSGLREEQEVLRRKLAGAIYACLGYGQVAWRETPEMVDTLWNVNILRAVPQVVPGPPPDAAWDAATRTLSTTVMPAGATRLEAWRLGPGGTPELLATGEFGSTGVVVPAAVTWDSGDLYQLWLVARNAKGVSEPGPSTSWTAP
jgi:hypothetical protein